jgi:glutathione synthase/RimK-type ligase-like ATP-grasp enzyme
MLMPVPLTLVTIEPGKPKNKNDSIVQMASHLFSLFRMKKNADLKIRLGHKTISTKLQTLEMDSNRMLIPENIINEFSLPIQTFKFQAIYHPDLNILELGPVIGLLTDFPSGTKEEPYFRSIHAFCKELHHGISESGGFFYVFSYEQFLNQGYYLSNGKWCSFEHPLPDVIYNRIHSRKLELSPKFKLFRQKLETLLIPLFNERFLSKWEVYNQIFLDNQLFSYLPKTKIFSKENLHELSQENETIFIKPVHGSQGRNIIRLKKENDNSYSIQTSISALNESTKGNYSLDEVYHLLRPIHQNNYFIIQQGIELATYESCAMDFRVLCHKIQNDHWQVTSAVARVAAEDQFVSNIARGGRMLKPLNVLRSLLGQRQSLEVLALMKKLALETSSLISSSSTGITGELGIDIGLDQNGKLWIIEVNSKPSKNFEDGLGKIRPSAKALIQFCTKLAFDSILVKEEK